MTYAASGFGRVPDVLLSQFQLANIQRTNARIFDVGRQLSSGRAISAPSDDPIRAAGISILDARLERAEQRLGNLSQATSALDQADAAMAEANDLLLQARDIALNQLNFGASAEERDGQAVIISSIIDGLFRTGNRESLVGHIFGGTQPGTPPVEQLLGGFLLSGNGDALLTDTGELRNIPVTLGIKDALGGRDARIEGTIDLDPSLRDGSRLDDLDGARGLGISLGAIELSINGDTPVSVDLTGAETVDDVINALDGAIRAYELDQGVTVLGPGGISAGADGLVFDVPAGDLLFTDVGASITGADLGLVTTPPQAFDAANTTGAALGPALSFDTPITSLRGLGSGSLGSIAISNGGLTQQVDLSAAETVQDVVSLIEGTNLGVSVEISDDGSSLNVINNLAHSSDRALSIAEVPGNGGTAALLGIRSFGAGTPISTLNHGAGVEVATGGIDPTTGLPDPALDTDFTITLGDGFEISIDLQPSDLDSVGSVIAAINTQADAQLAAAGRPAGDFTAGLVDGPNGIAFEQGAALGGSIEITPRNNSLAAEQLGLLGGTYDAATNRLVGEDRATVRVDSLFGALIDLRDALLNDDTVGIGLAGERLGELVDPLAQTRARTGSQAQRLSRESERLESTRVLDEQIRSELRDTDFTTAASEFSLLQTQLQASLQVTSIAGQLTLLDFLG